MTILTLQSRTHLDRVTVLLLGTGHRLDELSRHLPHGWLVIHRTRLLSGGHEPDMVVLDHPDARTVTAACLRHPRAAVIAVISPYSDHQEVVDVLDAGADACVRSNNTAVVAAHVEACRRRQAA